MRYKLLNAIRLGNFKETEELLKSGAFNVNENDLVNTMNVLNSPNHRLALSSIVHVVVSMNNPKILSLFVDVYSANIRQIEETSQTKFLSVLINRVFDNDISTYSAIKNLDILYRNGASIPESVVEQLIINFDRMPNCRDNLRKIIRKLYLLKATNTFLEHLKNNEIASARRIRTKNIKTLYPGLERLDISGYIDPNYDAGIHGMAILIAAEHTTSRILDFLIEEGQEEELSWLKRTDLSLSNTQGLTILHIFAMTGNFYMVKDWLFDRVNENQILQLLTKTVDRPDGKKYTPNLLANLYGYHEFASFLENFAMEHNDFVFDQIKIRTPERLEELCGAGFLFNRVHSVNLGNALHYAVSGEVFMNIRWVWNKLSTPERIKFLLGKVQYTTNGVSEFVSPLELAEKMGRDHCARILRNLTVELVEVVDSATLNTLKDAGYDLINFLQNFAEENRNLALEQIITQNPEELKELYRKGFRFNRLHSDTLGNPLHYAVLGKFFANMRWVWNRLSTPEKLQFLVGKVQYTIDGVNELVSPLELAQKTGRNHCVQILQNLAVELVEVLNPATLSELKVAGYNLSYTDTKKPNALYYAVLRQQTDNLTFLLNEASILEIAPLLTERMSFLNRHLEHVSSTLLELAETKGTPQIVHLFGYYRRQAELNPPPHDNGMMQKFGQI